MKLTISHKVFWAIFVVVLLILLISWFIIDVYMEDYYSWQKKESMKNIVTSIEQELDTKYSTEELSSLLDYYSSTENMSIAIYDSKLSLLYMSGNFRKSTMGMGHMSESKKYSTNAKEYYYNEQTMKGNIEWMVYRKVLDSGGIIILSTPIQSLSEAVNILQKFYLYIIIIAIITALFSSYILSKNITLPLVELNNIASEIGKLNFSLKCNEDRKDEIGQLGRTFNKLTTKLEETITRLQKELNKERTLDIMRKKFVAQVSHELQTPLSIINGYVEALQDDILENKNEQDEYYEVIRDETNKMSKIVKDLLDLSQLESGTFNIEKEVFDFGKLLKNIIKKYSDIYNEENISFKYSEIKKNIFVLGDHVRLEQCITNVINNAIKHTNKEGKINIKLKEYTEEIEINISNTGEQIPEKDLPYIWESFYKPHARKSKKGLGLGLAITKNILDMHNSKYSIENIENGVNFKFTLKIASNK